jgi:hypothetical protein
MSGSTKLLKDGQTIEEWWWKNGLDHEQARTKRQEAYTKQKQETMKVYLENSVTNQNWIFFWVGLRAHPEGCGTSQRNGVSIRRNNRSQLYIRSCTME